MVDDPLTSPFNFSDRYNTKSLSEQWAEFLDNGGRTAMMQTGQRLMQAPAFGQNNLAHVGQAVGEGGSAFNRHQKMQMAEDAADDRREKAAQSASLAEERMGMQRERLEMQRQKMGLGTLMKRKPVAETTPLADAAAANVAAMPKIEDPLEAQAREAIARGAPREQVIARLRQLRAAQASASAEPTDDGI